LREADQFLGSGHFGYDATAGVAHDWMYEKLAESYVLNDDVRDFMQ
jgi:cobaltochelatase CobN